MSSYTVKVRTSIPRTFLWGGDGITTRFGSSLFLTLRVDEVGEPIVFGIYKAGMGNAAPEEIEVGTLKQSETFTIELKDLTGVYAQCLDSNADTKVQCFLENLFSSTS
jgi:hypothetical protein